jgi:hypothetical protein
MRQNFLRVNPATAPGYGTSMTSTAAPLSG